MVLEQLATFFPLSEKRISTQTLHYTKKNKIKQITDSNVRANALEVNLEENLCDLGLASGFLGTKVTFHLKMLINQTSSKLKMFALQKTQENKKPCHRLRDNACKTNRRLLSRTHIHTHMISILQIDISIPYKISYVNLKYFISMSYKIYMSHCKSYICVYNRGLVVGVYCFKLLLLNNKEFPRWHTR